VSWKFLFHHIGKIFTRSRILKFFWKMKNSKSVMKIFYFINHRTIQKDLSSGKFLDDSIVLAILERKFLLRLRIIKFSQWRPLKAEDTSRYYCIWAWENDLALRHRKCRVSKIFMQINFENFKTFSDNYTSKNFYWE
jgi:hypothetical protein